MADAAKLSRQRGNWQAISIDVTRLLDRGLQGRLPTGVDRVSLEYVRHFGARARAVVRVAGRWLTLGEADSQRIFAELLNPSPNFRWVVRAIVAKNYATRSHSPRGALLLNTGHSGLHESGYGLKISSMALKPVFFLFDLIPLTHPEYCRAGEFEKHHQRLTTMLSFGSGIIVDSADVLGALEGFALKKKLPLPTCTVAHLAPGRLPVPAAARPIDAPYFVMLGTIEPRKNHLLLLHLWREMVAELGENAPRLVVIGQRGWECEQVEDLLDRCGTLRGFVIEKSRCSDAELSTWLGHCQALLFPSFTEGFGMPLVEALALGVPVIASHLPVFREIAGHIPDYLSPLDGTGWRHLVEDYAKPDSLARQAQYTRMQNYRAFTWEQHFEVVDDFLEACFQTTTPRA